MMTPPQGHGTQLLRQVGVGTVFQSCYRWLGRKSQTRPDRRHELDSFPFLSGHGFDLLVTSQIVCLTGHLGGGGQALGWKVFPGIYILGVWFQPLRESCCQARSFQSGQLMLLHYVSNEFVLRLQRLGTKTIQVLTDEPK